MLFKNKDRDRLKIKDGKRYTMQILNLKTWNDFIDSR